METKTTACIRGQLVNADPSGKKETVWVTFPTEDKDFEKALKAIGSPYRYYFCQWDFDDLPFDLDLGREPDLDHVNTIASSIAGYTDYELEIISYLNEYGEDLLYWLEKGVDDVTFIPDVFNDQDLGEYYYNECDIESQLPDNLSYYFDTEAYGRDIRLEQGGQFISAGYIATL